MGYGGVLLDNPDDVVPEVGVVACKLVCKGGKDVFEFLSVKLIPRTEEAGTKESLFSHCFRE